MPDQKETLRTEEYTEAWIKAEREAIICEFQDKSAWGWDSGIQDLEPLNESETEKMKDSV